MGWRYTTSELAAALGGTLHGGDGQVITGVSTDTRKIAPGQVFFALKGPNFDADQFVPEAFSRGASAAVCRVPSSAGPCVVVEDALVALKVFAIWHREKLSPSLIGITGSCGKTTSKDMIHALLSTKYSTVKTQGNLNNDIGVPLTLLALDADTQCGVIEMGANHVGEIRELCAMARPRMSAVTLVAPAHLEGFGSIERVAQAKAEIMEGLPADGTFFVNVDNPYTRAMGGRWTGKKVYFGSSGDIVIRSVSYDRSGEMLLDLAPVGLMRLPLPVKAHAHNVALAVGVALEHGITEFEGPLREAAQAAARFKVLEAGGVELLDDTYNASPASVLAALEALGLRPAREKRIAALGSMLELGAEAGRLHRECGEAAVRHGARAVFARGPNAADYVAGARAAGAELAEAVEDHADMARAIAALVSSGDAVLLKGSRGMRMERVLDELKTILGPHGGEGNA